ncbi:putative phosphonate metabolism protein [Rhizobium sp. AG855]|nr:putative phosphonate metabolism protein [Rhizobium sp. AG855]
MRLRSIQHFESTTLRYALYFTPAEDAPLTRTASTWLGRDAFSGAVLTQEDHPEIGFDEISALTEDPRRYGFHATLKAPFSLKDGCSEADLLAAMTAFCRNHSTFAIPSVVMGQLGPFFALVPETPHPPLQDFAAAVVEFFEPFRAPLSDADIARRNPERLGERQRQNLFTWGYPHVFDDFRFHMTLSGPVPEQRADVMAQLLERRFSPFTRRALAIDSLTLFIEPERGAPFIVHSRQPLSPAPTNGYHHG